jgi:hypothetical protein
MCRRALLISVLSDSLPSSQYSGLVRRFFLRSKRRLVCFGVRIGLLRSLGLGVWLFLWLRRGRSLIVLLMEDLLVCRPLVSAGLTCTMCVFSKHVVAAVLLLSGVRKRRC